MALLSLTASHHELDLDALERLSTGAHSIGGSAVAACDVITGAVVLATCNRFELYLDVDAPLDGPGVQHATEHVARMVADASGVDVAEALASFRARAGTEVAEHLFAVASGLDSMVVGEREIAGQVKRALETAHADGVTSSTLELLFQTASRTSKKVSTQTTLGGAGRSVVALGLDLAAAELPPWHQVRAVLIGTGSYAGASLAALRTLGCDDVRVYSQSGRAEEFAAARGVEAVTDLVAALEDADLVVSCSGARGRALVGDDGPAAARREQAIEHVLDAAAVVRARERAAVRAGDEPEARPTVVLDLALHRDVDPRVADVEGVLLYDLATLAAHSPSIASELVVQARAIVDDATRAFEETRLGRAADTAVVALLADAERRVALEVADVVALREADGDPVEPDESDEIARAVRRRVHADLHRAIVEARAEAVAAAQAEERAVVADAQALADEAATTARPTSPGSLPTPAAR
ncbi:glutamyl-tRNA reductase [Cellulosimicrobium cellulans]|uniref:Glutamyl-tRNA reductase n=1 Tax=Cellulosimicrobium cellulans TaxID=1710 RepID=A0A1Y0HUE2_CELCE|nr:glutamyl-tRNA reductase [Cellulosimicrobium cellulans]ARU51719.1 glutamyl-tRNA reductase [Cellulosimicrobium cellulans]